MDLFHDFVLLMSIFVQPFELTFVFHISLFQSRCTVLERMTNNIRASDRVWQKMGNSAAFSREIMRQERSIMRQIMRFS